MGDSASYSVSAILHIVSLLQGLMEVTFQDIDTDSELTVSRVDIYSHYSQTPIFKHKSQTH